MEIALLVLLPVCTLAVWIALGISVFKMKNSSSASTRQLRRRRQKTVLIIAIVLTALTISYTLAFFIVMSESPPTPIP